MADIAAVIPFRDVHGFASGMAGYVERRPHVHTDGFNDQRIAFPMANRIGVIEVIRFLYPLNAFKLTVFQQSRI